MSYLLKMLWRLLPHFTIILALCFLVFLILDWYNPLMAFITNDISTRLLAVFCVVSILTAIKSLWIRKKR